jgi:hypothetical protein
MSRALFVVPSGSSACMAQQAGICCQCLPDRLALDVAGRVYQVELALGETGGGIELRSTPTGRYPSACAWTSTIIPTRNASRFCRHLGRRRSTSPRTPGTQFLFAGRGILVHGPAKRTLREFRHQSLVVVIVAALGEPSRLVNGGLPENSTATATGGN